MAFLDTLQGEVRKVAILRASHIGDFVCATPAFRALRRVLPGAEVSLIGLPFVRPLVERSPYLDRFILFPGFPGIAEQMYEPGRAVRFFERMQAERFDLAVQLHGTGLYSNPFTLMLGARRTAGFVRPEDAFWRLDCSCVFPEEGREVRRLLELVEEMGARVDDDETEFPLTEEDRSHAQGFLVGARRPLIGVHTGAREAGKRSHANALARAASCVARRLGGTLVLVGARSPSSAGTKPGIAPGEDVLDLRGRTSLPVLGAVIEALDLFVGNDSGPAQIAYAFGTPSVTRFLTTDPARWGPPARERHQVVEGAGLDARQQELAILDAAERAISASRAVGVLRGADNLTPAAALRPGSGHARPDPSTERGYCR